jgi:hypothetical protein
MKPMMATIIAVGSTPVMRIFEEDKGMVEMRVRGISAMVDKENVKIFL